MRNHVKKLLLGNGIAQLLQLISVFVLSRLYESSEFGMLAQVQSIAMVLAIIITLQLHLTIPLTANAIEACAALECIQTLSIVFFLVFLFPAICFGKVAIFSIILALFLGLANIYNGYLIFNGSFGKLSGFYIARSLAIITSQIIFAYFSLSDGLVWSTLFGEGLSALYLKNTQLPRHENRFNNLSRPILAYIKRFKSYSLYGTLQEVVSVAAFYAPLYFFSIKYGNEIGGQYAMASRLVWAPVILVSSAVSRPLLHQFGRNKINNIGELMSVLPGKIYILIMIGMCLISFNRQDLLIFALGAEWQLAGELFPFLLTWGIFFFFFTPFRVGMHILEMHKYRLVIDIGILFIIGALFLIKTLSPINAMQGILLIAIGQNVSLALIVARKLVLPKIARSPIS